MRKFTRLLLSVILTAGVICAQAQDQTIIKEQPAGKLVSMSRNTMAATTVALPSGATLETRSLQNLISEIVEGDDGNIYIKNPFTYWHTNSWIKAERDGERVVVHTPQPVYQQGTSIFYLAKICIKSVQKLGDDQFADPEAGDEDIVFTYKNGVLSQVRETVQSFDGNGNPTQVEASPMLALVSSNYSKKGNCESWTGYGDYNLTLTAVTDEVNTLPEDAEVQSYQMSFTLDGSQYQSFVNMAFVGNDVYMNVFKDYMPNAWAKGTLSGNKVTFRSGQYLGPYLDAPRAESMASYAHIYFMTGAYDASKQSSTSDGYYLTDDIVFSYDAATRTLTSANGMMAINSGKTALSYFLLYYKPTLTPFAEKVGTLRTPRIVTGDCDPVSANVWGDGTGSFTFELYNSDTDGNLLDQSSLTYTIYDEDQPITIDGKTDLPFYLYMDAAPIWSEASSAGVLVAYYFTDKNIDSHTLTVQQKFTDTQGVAHLSPKAGYNYATGKAVSGISDAQTAATAGQTQVFSLQGRRLQAPQKGLNIVRKPNGKTIKLMQR